MIVQIWEGIPLQVTEQMLPIFQGLTYASFPDNCCGAGKGFWEWVVPDYIAVADQTDIKIAPACDIHDKDWDLAKPTWDDFHDANSRLYANIKSIIQCKAETELAERYANRFPAIYAHAVDTAGRKVFWNVKKSQGYHIPRSAAWLI